MSSNHGRTRDVCWRATYSAADWPTTPPPPPRRSSSFTPSSTTHRSTIVFTPGWTLAFRSRRGGASDSPSTSLWSSATSRRWPSTAGRTRSSSAATRSSSRRMMPVMRCIRSPRRWRCCGDRSSSSASTCGRRSRSLPPTGMSGFWRRPRAAWWRFRACRARRCDAPTGCARRLGRRTAKWTCDGAMWGMRARRRRRRRERKRKMGKKRRRTLHRR